MSIVYERNKNIVAKTKTNSDYLLFVEKDFQEGEGDIVKFSDDNSVIITGVKPGVNPNDVATVSQLGEGGSSLTSVTITLLASGWVEDIQVVSVPGILADVTKQAIWPAPLSESEDNYFKFGIRAVSQATDSLTFKCSSTPDSDIQVLIQIIG